MGSISFPRMPLPTKWRYAGVLFLLPFMACQSGETTLTRFEDSPVIDRLLDSAPHFVVNTDSIDAERWVATTRLGLPTDSLILGRPSSMIAVGDSVYISEQFGNIFAVGTDGYLGRQIGRQGKGPGEFNYLRGLQYNGSHVFTQGAERIQVFTDKFEYVQSFFYFGLGHRRFSVSPDYVFLPCRGADWLVCARSTSPPFDWIPSIELLPVLDIPGRTGENATEVTVSPEGDRVAVAYTGLPYIFVYDDRFGHLRTIRFAGGVVDNFNPVSTPSGAPAGVEPGTRGFISTIKFINSRYLVAIAPVMNNYVFDLSEDDYEVARKIIFRPIDDTKEIDIVDFFLHGDYLYVSSWWEEYVYGYEFDLE